MIVSIVVVNYNGRELLNGILGSIQRQDFRDFELIVVDNASTDGSIEIVKSKYPQARIIQNETNEGYVGINSAIKHCKGKYILFLNNDLELDKKCLRELVNAAKSGKAAMSAPMLVNFHDKNLKSGGTWVSRAFYNGHVRAKGNEKIKEIPYMGIGLIEKSVVMKFGYLFDPDYFIYAEDLDLGLRLRLLGLKIVFAPRAVAYHMHAATIGRTKDYRRTFLMERNLLVTFLKILSLKNILVYSPYVKSARLVAMARDFLSLRFMNGLARLYAMFWVMLHIGKVLEKRKSVQKLRKANDEYILKSFSEKELFGRKFIV